MIKYRTSIVMKSYRPKICKKDDKAEYKAEIKLWKIRKYLMIDLKKYNIW